MDFRKITYNKGNKINLTKNTEGIKILYNHGEDAWFNPDRSKNHRNSK